jgi:hypothetical protein
MAAKCARGRRRTSIHPCGRVLVRRPGLECAAVERHVRKNLAKGALWRWHHADRHQSAIPGRVWLTDGPASHLGARQTREKPFDGLFPCYGQNHSVRGIWEVAGTRFARGVNDLRCKYTKRKVAAHNNVVRERVVEIRPGVNASCAWSLSYTPRARRQASQPISFKTSCASGCFSNSA